MKKKLLSFIFTLCLIIPAIFMLSACGSTKQKDIEVRVKDGYVQWSYEDEETWTNVISVDDVKDALGEGYQGIQGEAGREVEFRRWSTHIQWRYVGDSTWRNLIAVSDLKGEDGIDGTNGTDGVDGEDGQDGEDGREVEFQTTSTHIQWRYVGETNWRNLIALSELKGQDGIDGTNGTDGVDGEDGQDGREVEFRTTSTLIQWRYVGDSTWRNLIAVSELKGQDGIDGTNGTDGVDGEDGQDGEDGREVEFRKTSTYIQWRYVGETNWRDLIALSEIKGEDLVSEDCLISYDFNLGSSVSQTINQQLFNIFDYEGFNKSVAIVEEGIINIVYTQTAEKGKYFKLYDNFESIGLGDYFLGWYVDDVKVNCLNVVAENITLKAKWTKPITSLLCTEQVDYQYYKEQDGAFTVSAYPKFDGNYTKWNGAKIFNLNELTIYNNKFYKIDKYSAYVSGDKSGNEEPKVDVICVPETAISQFDWDIKSNSELTMDLYFQTHNIQNNKYIIGDYVIIQDFNGSTIIQYVYKVNYNRCEAVLVNSFTLKGNQIKGNYSYAIEDFTIKKDGKDINIEVIGIDDYWFKPWYAINNNYIAENNCEYNFIISNNIKLIGEFNFLEPQDFDDSLYDLSKIIRFNFYSLNNDISNIVIKGSGLTGNNIKFDFEIYQYSSTQPSSEGNYWHYDTDASTPIVWDFVVDEINERGFELFTSKLNDMRSKSSYKLVYDYQNKQTIEYYASLSVIDNSLMDKGGYGVSASNVFGFNLHCIQYDSGAALEDGILYNPYKLSLFGQQNGDWISTHKIDVTCYKNSINNEFKLVEAVIDDNYEVDYSYLSRDTYGFVTMIEKFELEQIKSCEFNENGDCKITFYYNANGSNNMFNKNFIYEFCVNKDGYIERCTIYEKDFLNPKQQANEYCRITFFEGESDITQDMFNAIINSVKVGEYENADLVSIFGYKVKE